MHTSEATAPTLSPLHGTVAMDHDTDGQIQHPSSPAAAAPSASMQDHRVEQVRDGSLFAAHLGMQSSPASASPMPVEHRSLPGVETSTPLDDQIPARLRLDADGGQSRYYGPTSQRYLHSTQPVIANDVAEMQISVDRNSLPLRNSLLKTFWNVQVNSVVVIDKRLFTAHRAAGTRSQYYSKFLEDSLLACATRMSTSQSVRRLGSAYMESAKAEIGSELENPSISTLQAFLLLSDCEATRGRDRLGYMYNGVSSFDTATQSPMFTSFRYWLPTPFRSRIA